MICLSSCLWSVSHLRYVSTKIGASLFDKAGAEAIPEFRTGNEEKFAYPNDYVISPKFPRPETPEEIAQVRTVPAKEGIPAGMLGLDIGDESRKYFRSIILDEKTKTILWNGPPGVFEQDLFAAGSKDMLAACKEAVRQGKKVIIGGGDTATVVSEFSKTDNDPTELTHISTGGGASLELLEGKVSP